MKKPDPAEVPSLDEALQLALGVRSGMTSSYVRAAVLLSNFVEHNETLLRAAFLGGEEIKSIDDGD